MTFNPDADGLREVIAIRWLSADQTLALYRRSPSTDPLPRLQIVGQWNHCDVGVIQPVVEILSLLIGRTFIEVPDKKGIAYQWDQTPDSPETLFM